jgi:hypothetical protein
MLPRLKPPCKGGPIEAEVGADAGIVRDAQVVLEEKKIDRTVHGATGV